MRSFMKKQKGKETSKWKSLEAEITRMCRTAVSGQKVRV